MQALEYVELDIPFCGLIYGVAPCRARVSSTNDPVAAGFEAVSPASLKRGGGLTGAADGKLLTFSGWVRKDVTSNQILITSATALNGGTIRTAVGLESAGGGRFFVNGYNAAGTLILQIQSNIIPVGPWAHVLASIDLSNPAKCFLYVNDVSTISVTAFTNDNIDFTMPDWSVGASPDGSSTLDGSIADLWFAPGVYLDLSVQANRRKFIDDDGNPVSLGATGNTPTGTAPLVFMSGDLASWHTNKGTGGGFTKVGTLTVDDFGTGALKCFNSKNTCQSTATFDPDDVTLRFARATDYLPRDIECIPSLSEVSFTPATVSLGENLGTRATLQATFLDHPHTDTGNGFDKYRTERDYDPYSQGTFWGKFRARQPFLRGQAVRWITGLVGDDISDMETLHFIVDSFDGPTPAGKYTLIAKDILKLADGDRSQAPVLSSGFLSADITISATSASLLPSGIGNAEYPASGYLAIGGNEVVSFTRSADALTIVRAQLGSVASTHKAQDRVQQILRYSSEDAADIIYDLLVTYAGVDASYITLADWQAETAAFLGNVYSSNICEPTSVATLISELIVQAALAVWDDNVEQQIRLRVLHGVITDSDTFTPDNTLAGTLTLKEQPEKRLSRIQTYFGQIDPTKPLSNLDNYRSTSLVIDDEAETDYGSAAIKTILSRWIPQAGRSVADRVGTVQLGRYRDPPRHVSFSTSRYAETDVDLGVGYRIESFCVQDATGAQAQIPVQVTRVNPGPAQFVAEAEEMLFTAPAVDLTNRLVIIDANNFNINLRAAHDSIYPAASSGDHVTLIVNAGVILGSTASTLPALDIGSWPVGVVVAVTVLGRIQGCGATGGYGAYTGVYGPAGGEHGGTAIYSRRAFNLAVSLGEIWGGAGGGGGGAPRFGTYGGGGGGGGAGTQHGLGGGSVSLAAPGQPSTDATGGAGGTGSVPNGYGGGNGGDVGQPGFTGAGPGAGVGGAAGPAIDGVSFVTVTAGPGSILGPQIN